MVEKRTKTKKAPSDDFSFRLRTLYIRDSSFALSKEFDPSIPGQNLYGKWKVVSQDIEFVILEDEEKVRPSLCACAYLTNFEFRYLLSLPDDQERKDDSNMDHWAARVTAQIHSEYFVPHHEKEREFFEQWGRRNVMLHCWPYWREYLQNSLPRMQLPNTLLPMMTFLE